MKEYMITYLSNEESGEFVGSGHGCNGQEAVRDFLSWHYDCDKILSVRFYKDHSKVA